MPRQTSMLLSLPLPLTMHYTLFTVTVSFSSLPLYPTTLRFCYRFLSISSFPPAVFPQRHGSISTPVSQAVSTDSTLRTRRRLRGRTCLPVSISTSTSFGHSFHRHHLRHYHNETATPPPDHYQHHHYHILTKTRIPQPGTTVNSLVYHRSITATATTLALSSPPP